MRKLLDASSQRLIKILETFTLHNGWITLSKLSSLVGASERTLAEDVSNLQKRWGDSLNIEVSRKNGVIMHNRNTACISSVFTDLFNDSVALLWIKELLFHPNMSIEFYEGRLFVSRSTLNRLLIKINLFLSDMGTAIRCDNNRYQLIGNDEQHLRNFCASFLLEMYGLDIQKYDLTIDVNAIGEIITFLLSKYLEPMELSLVLNDDISMIYLIMFYLVSLMRESQGYTVTSDYTVEKEINANTLTFLQEQFPNISLDNLRPIHQFVFNQYCGWDSDEEEDLVNNETETFFQQLFTLIPVSPNENTQHMMHFSLKSLYLEKKYHTRKTSTLFDRIYYFSLSLKRRNSFLYEVVEENLKQFSQNVNLDIVSNVNDVLYWLCIICPELCEYSPPRKALLITDFGMPHANFLSKVLSDFFNNKTDSLRIDIDRYPQTLTSDKTKSYDIIITTIPKLKKHHENIFLINDYPSCEDFMDIYLALSN
ncbi:helix-turn-helix domain-containing protein [Anaerosporobacter sp.]